MTAPQQFGGSGQSPGTGADYYNTHHASLTAVATRGRGASWVA